MSIHCYLAMTAAEFYSAEELPPHIAWMACHFSSYGTGLSNFPPPLPPGSMLIVNDRTPLHGHDPQQITDELSALAERIPDCRILLDFQRPDCREAEVLASTLPTQLSCPVGVSDRYAKDLSCPIFLPPPSLHIPLQDYLAPWAQREIWLEAATAQETLTVTQQGCQTDSQLLSNTPDGRFTEERLHCQYSTQIRKDSVIFTLRRDREQLDALLKEAEKLGVTTAIGLYQQLKAPGE